MFEVSPPVTDKDLFTGLDILVRSVNDHTTPSVHHKLRGDVRLAVVVHEARDVAILTGCDVGGLVEVEDVLITSSQRHQRMKPAKILTDDSASGYQLISKRSFAHDSCLSNVAHVLADIGDHVLEVVDT